MIAVYRPAHRLSPPRVPAPTILLFVPLAGWYSLARAVGPGLQRGESGIVLVVLALAAWLFVRDATRREYSPTTGDRTVAHVEAILAGCLLLAGLWLVALLPERLSWYFWLYRFDLLIIPIASTALVMTCWGLSGIAVTWRALLYALLACPAPFIWARQTIAPTVDRGLEAALGLVQRAAQVELVGASSLLQGVGSALVIAPVELLAVTAPLLATWTGAAPRKIGWLALGGLVALVAAFVRELLLGLAALAAGPEPDAILRPVADVAVWSLVLVVMLTQTDRFGLDPDRRPLVSPYHTLFTRLLEPAGRRLNLLLVGSLVLGVSQLALQPFGAIADGTLARASTAAPWSFLPDLAGWTRRIRPGPDPRELYGPDARSFVVDYRPLEATSAVEAEVILSSDRRLLGLASPERLADREPGRLLESSQVTLGFGVTARLLRTDEVNHLDTAAGMRTQLYWYLPVMLDTGLVHARIKLTGAPGPHPAWLPPLTNGFPTGPVPPAELEAAPPTRQERELVAFGQRLVEAVVRRNPAVVR